MKKDLLKNLPLLLFFMFFILPMLGKNFVLFVVVIIGAIFIYYKLKNKQNPSSGDADKKYAIDLDKLKSMQNIKRLVFSIIGVIFALWLFFASIVIIDAGETGVYSLFGKVKDEELKSGFHLVIPLARVTRMSIRTEEYTMSIAQGEGKKYAADAISSLTKEGLSVDLDMTVLYRLEEAKASDVYSDLGLTYEEKIIRPTIRTVIRDVIAQYEAKDIYSEKREEAANQITLKIKDSLDEKGLIIEDVLLRNVNLPANLAQSIQEKLQAEQEAQKYEFLLQRESKEKERKIIEAEGQRDAQKIINESLTSNYLYYLYINDLKSRQGTIYVPTNPSTGMPLFRDLGK